MTKPCRNSINIYNGYVNLDILSEKLKNFILSNKIIFKDNFNYFLQSTSKHFGIFTDDDDLIKLLNNKDLKYLKIKDKILKNDLLEESFHDIQLYRSFDSFHQQCEVNRKIIWETILKNIQNTFTKFLLIGGESYFFGKFIQHKIKHPNIYCYLNHKSIYDDFILNTKITPNLVKFTEIELKKIDFDMTILNVSTNGLKGNVLSEFMKINSKIVIYIDCNIKKFTKEFKTLSEKYKEIERLKIHTEETGYDFTFFIHILELRSC